MVAGFVNAKERALVCFILIELQLTVSSMKHIAKFKEFIDLCLTPILNRFILSIYLYLFVAQHFTARILEGNGRELQSLHAQEKA